MKLFILEGSNDVQFFKSFLTKILKAKDISGRKKVKIDNETYNILELSLNFRRILERGDARIDVLVLNNEIIVLLSIGGKGMFKDTLNKLVKGLRGLTDKLNLTQIVFVGDADAKNIVEKSVEALKKTLSERKTIVGTERIRKKSLENLSVKGLIYKGKLEDLILSFYDKIKHDLEDVETIDRMLEVLSEKYNDKFLEKRKVCCIKAVLSPRCFGHLFDTIFEFAKDYDIDEFYELKTFKELLQ